MQQPLSMKQSFHVSMKLFPTLYNFCFRYAINNTMKHNGRTRYSNRGQIAGADSGLDMLLIAMEEQKGQEEKPELFNTWGSWFTPMDEWDVPESDVYHINLVREYKEKIISGNIIFQKLFDDKILRKYPSLKNAFQKVLGNLTSKEYRILNGIYGYDCFTISRVARELNISRSTARIYYDRGIKKIVSKLSNIESHEKIKHNTAITLPV